MSDKEQIQDFILDAMEQVLTDIKMFRENPELWIDSENLISQKRAVLNCLELLKNRINRNLP